MDDTRRQLLTVAVAAALVGGGFLAFEYFLESGPPVDGEVDSQAASGDGSEASADDGGEGEGATDDGEDAQHARRAAEREVSLETDRYVATFTNLNAALVSFELKGERFLEDDDKPHQMVTTDREPFYPLGLELRGVAVPDDAVWEVEQPSAKKVRFVWSGNGFQVARTFEPGDGPYQLWSTLTVTNQSAGSRPVRPVVTAYHYVTTEAEGGGFIGRPSPELSKGSCHYGDETVREQGEDLYAGQGYGPTVRWTGIENVYFGTLLAPGGGGTAHRCQLKSSPRGGTVDDPVGTLFEARLVHERAEIAAGASESWRTLAYIGPKEHDWLEAAGHQLVEAVDLGWFDWIAEWLVALLRWIQGAVGNWGLSIILLTFLVKIVLYPLTEKSFQSMARMRQLKPEMDRINELHADDREKKGMAMMELYRKHKINPLGGCLPTLLQLPIWFALYQSLSTNVELYHAPFALWWGDLSSPDPYYVLPLVLGGLMFLQQRLTPTTMDATQAKVMMYFMPVMITVFMLFLPAGLCLYMVTNSSLGIAQQRWIQWRLERETSGQDASTEAGAEQGESATADDGQAPGAGGDGAPADGAAASKSKPKSKPKGKKAKSTSRAKRGDKRRQRRGRA